MDPSKSGSSESEAVTECAGHNKESHININIFSFRRMLNEEEEAEADKFLAVRFTRLEVSPASLPNTVKHTKVLKSDQVLKLRRRRRKKPLLKESRLGRFESLTDDEGEDEKEKSSAVFGRKFSLSLENFSCLSLREEKGDQQSSQQFNTNTFKTLNGCGGKRKRAVTPESEAGGAGRGAGLGVGQQQQASPAQPTTCGQQARAVYSDVTVDDLAGYLDDTAFFPKRMSYMAEMMYT